MSLVREDDLIASVADALQYISYYHTPDFIAAMGRAYELEQSAPARDAIAHVRYLRPGSVETPEQEQAILDWGRRVKKG